MSEQVQDLIAVECAIQREWDALQAVLSYAERFVKEVAMQLQPVKPDMPVRRSDIVAQCEGAYLCKSRAQYTLVVEEPFTKRQWSRRKVNFEMALEKANEVLASLNKKEEAMNEKPITIESDFINHVDDQPCRDLTCPCHAERDVSVNLSAYTRAEFDRKGKMLSISWGAGRFIVLSPDETYRLLALLHAEMPASSS